MITRPILRSCPFCGGTAKVVSWISGDEAWVECSRYKTCATIGPSRDTKDAAIAAWNKRTARIWEGNAKT
jgi:Lar family restriction alleviation protein